ncbi:MAG: hypothetical protein ROO76_19340 [Terriglobia bacterium]|jgi:hypothetical protein|nr:hypothetical protein [Terriglobia bacterium]
MATTAANVPPVIHSLPGRRYDHQFFAGTAILMVVTVLAGFARTYYLAGVFHAPLPSLIIHIHGAVFSGWLLLFIAQLSLVSLGRVDLHRRLGIVAFLYAGVMIVLGLLAATDSLVRKLGPAGRDPKVFYIIPVTEILAFAILMAFAFRYRRIPATHKRLIYVANAALVLPAIARMAAGSLKGNNPVLALISNSFLVLLVAYDYWSNRKISRATVYASLFLIFIQQARAPLSHTATWISFAAWVQHAAHRII